ncbi:MAG: transcriptional repressor [Clostridiales bacterium]|nr:transcriptional repressor [Clostridiales bacterium]
MKERRLKRTSQRLVIVDILAGSRSHPSAFDIFAEARKKEPKISLSTVYYTLDSLKKAGLIRELEFDDLNNRYEGDICEHLNLVCRACGKIEDFPASSPVSPQEVEEKTGFMVEGVRLDFYGLCRKCQA